MRAQPVSNADVKQFCFAASTHNELSHALAAHSRLDAAMAKGPTPNTTANTGTCQRSCQTGNAMWVSAVFMATVLGNNTSLSWCTCNRKQMLKRGAPQLGPGTRGHSQGLRCD
ncbi:unnamed protein product [Polarella glacialis]|uniref:Uncharacterized protein n=1 Tax=Polarella glacialis TaxID=89957 RepID=A0A813FMZ8_POLGL|nr:unnamed protein product [Polarella glacialis]